jgi:hypothetical protein
VMSELSAGSGPGWHSSGKSIGTDQLVDEMVVRFTHTVEMDWMLPGVAPTGKRVEVALVVIVHFRDGKLAHEHIYWDQASVLAQLGLIDAATLPVCGADTARKALAPSLPANALIRRAALISEGPVPSTARRGDGRVRGQIEFRPDNRERSNQIVDVCLAAQRRGLTNHIPRPLVEKAGYSSSRPSGEALS